jgi:hypothetical protein
MAIAQRLIGLIAPTKYCPRITREFDQDQFFAAKARR